MNERGQLGTTFFSGQQRLSANMTRPSSSLSKIKTLGQIEREFSILTRLSCLVKLLVQLIYPLPEDDIIVHVPSIDSKIPEHPVPSACPLATYRRVWSKYLTCTVPSVPVSQTLYEVRQADSKNFFLVAVAIPGFKGVNRVPGKGRTNWEKVHFFLLWAFSK